MWAVPLRTTKASEMVQALKLVLEEGRSPQNLRTDKGVEFKNKEVKKRMEQSGIYHFFTQNESKVNYAEPSRTSSRDLVAIAVAIRATEGRNLTAGFPTMNYTNTV